LKTLSTENNESLSTRPVILILNRVVRLLLIIACVGLLPIHPAYSAEIDLAWESSDGATGYYLHYGLESRSYDVKKDIGPTTEYTAPNLEDNKKYFFAVSSYNNNGESGLSNEVSAETFGTQNEPPTADAGDDQTVDSGEPAFLDGSYSSDPEQGPLTYKWQQIEGTLVTLSDYSAIEPKFDSPEINTAKETLTFMLTVTDDSNASGSDTVNILVNDVAADDGDDDNNNNLNISNLYVASGKSYEVVEGLPDGNACYIDRSYKYRNVPDFLKGAVYIKTANNDKKNMADPFLSFDVNTDVTVYVAFDNRVSTPFWLSDFSDTGYDLRTDVWFSIYAKDFPAGSVTLGPNGHSGSMYTVIIVNNGGPIDPQNEPPTADAGDDQTVYIGDIVLLDGSNSSDPDDGIETYHWEQIEGTPVALSDSSAIEPDFVSPQINTAKETLIFKLTVTDDRNASDSDTVNILVNDDPDNNTLIISNLYVASGRSYKVVEGLTDGNACYIDRSYTYSNVPDFLQGAVYFKTANDDKKNTTDPFLSFDVNMDVIFYVAFDNRHSKPSWLSNFVDTGYDLKTDVSFSIYAKNFPAGSVILGPNGYRRSSMYTVIVK